MAHQIDLNNMSEKELKNLCHAEDGIAKVTDLMSKIVHDASGELYVYSSRLIDAMAQDRPDVGETFVEFIRQLRDSHHAICDAERIFSRLNEGLRKYGRP